MTRADVMKRLRTACEPWEFAYPSLRASREACAALWAAWMGWA